jgi:ubiquinone/menaquinone biosynthesis C-methylase UbiE
LTTIKAPFLLEGFVQTMDSDKFYSATAMPDRDWWQALWPDPEGMLRALGIKPEMTVLDLCCGDGYFTAPLAALVEGKVIGLDIDPDMLDQARAEVSRLGASVSRWICGDADDLEDLLSERVDFVLIANTFHGVPDQTGLARTAASALKPGGLFAVVNWHQIAREKTTVLGKPRGPKTEMRMATEDVRKVVEPAGFQLADVVELPPYHYGAVFQKPRVEL